VPVPHRARGGIVTCSDDGTGCGVARPSVHGHRRHRTVLALAARTGHPGPTQERAHGTPDRACVRTWSARARRPRGVPRRRCARRLLPERPRGMPRRRSHRTGLLRVRGAPLGARRVLPQQRRDHRRPRAPRPDPRSGGPSVQRHRRHGGGGRGPRGISGTDAVRPDGGQPTLDRGARRRRMPPSPDRDPRRPHEGPHRARRSGSTPVHRDAGDPRLAGRRAPPRRQRARGTHRQAPPPRRPPLADPAVRTASRRATAPDRSRLPAGSARDRIRRLGIPLDARRVRPRPRPSERSPAPRVDRAPLHVALDRRSDRRDRPGRSRTTG